MSVSSGGDVRRWIGLGLFSVGVLLAVVLWPQVPLQPPSAINVDVLELITWVAEFALKGGIPPVFMAVGIRYM